VIIDAQKNLPSTGKDDSVRDLEVGIQRREGERYGPVGVFVVGLGMFSWGGGGKKKPRRRKMERTDRVARAGRSTSYPSVEKKAKGSGGVQRRD